jgi:hypothetical protein
MAAGNDSGNVAPRDIAVDFRAIPPPKKKKLKTPRTAPFRNCINFSWRIPTKRNTPINDANEFGKA